MIAKINFKDLSLIELLTIGFCLDEILSLPLALNRCLRLLLPFGTPSTNPRTLAPVERGAN